MEEVNNLDYGVEVIFWTMKIEGYNLEYTMYSPVNRPVYPKQIATEIINTPAFSL